jgi:predicted aspartyl protease
VIRAVLTLLVALGLAGCAGAPAERRGDNVCALIRLAEMPLEVHGNLLFVQAKISGRPVRLLVDTGAERTLLTGTAVEMLRLQFDHNTTTTLGIGSASTTWDALLPNGIELGGTLVPIDSVSVGHFSFDHVAGISADGILGADILLAFDVDLDLQADRIALYRPRSDCRDAAPPWNEPFEKVAGIDTRRDRLFVPFQLDGVDGMAVLDSGAQVSSIGTQMLQRIGLLEDDMATDRSVMAHGAAPDQVVVHLHRFHELRVGGVAAIQAPALPVVPMPSGTGDALLGADFLQGRRVWLSLSTQRIFITPVEQGRWLEVTASSHENDKLL